MLERVFFQVIADGPITFGRHIKAVAQGVVHACGKIRFQPQLSRIPVSLVADDGVIVPEYAGIRHVIISSARIFGNTVKRRRFEVNPQENIENPVPVLIGTQILVMTHRIPDLRPARDE